MFTETEEKSDMERSEWQEYLLNAPVDEIFSFSVPEYDLPGKSQDFNTIICKICGEGAPSIRCVCRTAKPYALTALKITAEVGSNERKKINMRKRQMFGSI